MSSLETIEALLKEFKKENKEDHAGIITRLDTTNGNVSKNTAFKNRAIGAFIIMNIFLVPMIIIVFRSFVSKLFE